MAIFTVTNSNDSGLGSLREAIAQANTMPGADVIDFSGVNEPIILTSAELKITDSLTIQGTGITVSGNNSSRVFNINDRQNNFTSTVIIDGLTIQNGFDYEGGAIFNRELTTIINSTINENTSISEDGSEQGVGGGIMNDAIGILTLQNSTISGNSALSGGGIYNSGQISLINSTISGNTATEQGGGIYNNGSATVINNTIAENSATFGGGLYNYSSGTLTLKNTIIAKNSEDLANNGTITEANNIVGDSENLKLEPLNNNDGLTKTYALMYGSIAINAGNNTNLPPGITTDQRGKERFIDGIVDIGAFEFQLSMPPPTPSISINDITVDDLGTNVNAVFTLTLSNASTTPITVQYATADGNAVAGEDYVAVNGVLTIAPGQTTATIAVPIVTDSLVELPKSFVLNLTNPTNATLADASGTGTIINLDPAQYGASYSDLIQTFGYNLNALRQHYADFGIAEGRSPDLFDENRYVASNLDLTTVFEIVNPTNRLVNADGAAEHYIKYGFDEKRSLNSFQSDQYIAFYGDLIDSFGYDLAQGTIHYIQFGLNEGRAADAFDEYRYLAGYDDLLNFYNTDALRATEQYIRLGYKPENRDPLAFKSDIYLASYGDLIESVKPIADYVDKLEFAGFHYVIHGRGEARVKEIFNSTSYLTNNPDVAANPIYGSDPTRHYIEFGYFEGRMI